MKPKLQYWVDLDRVFFSPTFIRQATTGPERTAWILLPPSGCPVGCLYCSCRNLRSNLRPSEENSREFIDQISHWLKREYLPETIKISNAGNLFHGSEFGGRMEVHEIFWNLLPSVLSLSSISKVEVETTIPDLASLEPTTPYGIARQRFVSLVQILRDVGKEPRAILALEYVGDLLAELGKFTPEDIQAAIQLVKDLGIGWLAYVMLGGRLQRRIFSSEEATGSAIEAGNLALREGTREVIVNCQYVDPLNRWESERDGIPFYLPDETDILKVMKALLDHCQPGRIRISADAEPVTVGTISPDLSPQFRHLISQFNEAPDQQDFYQVHLTESP